MKSHEKIRQKREEKKWSQEYMATQLGLSPNGYAKIERGETKLTLQRLNELAEIFEVDGMDLISDDMQNLNYRVGNNHITYSSDFTIYGAAENKDLQHELEKLKLIIQHQEQLIAQQQRELAITQKMLAIYEQKS